LTQEYATLIFSDYVIGSLMLNAKLENEVALDPKPMASKFLLTETTATHFQLNLGLAQTLDSS
jgi:hypothetical protein